MTDIMPVEGQLAPLFTAIDSVGNEVNLEDFRDKWVILYFYPKDFTSGCTKEACSLRDNFTQITDANAIVLGVSTDDQVSHQSFSMKLALPFQLIADTDAEVSKLYGVYGEKVRDGQTSMGIIRTTFIIDPKGKIAKVFKKVNVDDHAAEVLAIINGKI